MKFLARYYRKIVIAGAIADIITTGPFAFPVISDMNMNMIRKFGFSMQFSGAFPQFAPVHMFFVNLMGSMVLVWAILRIIKPEPLFGLFDGIAELFFIAWMILYNRVYHINDVILLFIVFEAVWCLLHIGGYLAWRKLASSN